MSAPVETALTAGARLAHFEVRRQIGGGAMGTVYEAWDSSLDRTVAVKVLRDRIAHDPAVVERFVREARAAARVNHPNLTHIYFVGREGDRPFFAMEYVPGLTLESLAERRGPLPLVEAVDLMTQAARGLAAAHAAAVVHRDVKPSNLIRRDDGTLKVADFGLAKSMGADVGATGGGSLMGTPTFMSPEQCRGRDVDARSDVYSLGLVAWFALAGRPPFASASLGEVINDHLNTPLPRVSELRPELGTAVDAVLARLCAKDPAERPASMDEVVSLLESLRPRPILLAPLFTRAAAALLDGLAALFTAIGILLLFAGLTALLDQIPGGPPGWVSDLIVLVGRIVVPGAAAALLVAPEAWWQTSLGKFLFDLRVVRPGGTRPSVVALALRFLIRFPGFLAVPFLYVDELRFAAFVAGASLQVAALVAGVVLYLSRDGLTLSDVLTRTRVAYRRDAV